LRRRRDWPGIHNLEDERSLAAFRSLEDSGI
jgi:hypothetical protein